MKTLVAGFLTMFHIIAGVAFGQVSQAWVQRFTSDSTRNEVVNDMFVDAQGNVYVTGSQRHTTANGDMQAVTVKYNSQGVQQWIQNYVDSANHGALCRAIHVDGSGNVYVTGSAGVFGPPYDMLVIKYSPSGTQLWSQRYRYTTAGSHYGYDVVTDLTGNVYVAGEYSGDANNVFLVKFDPSGALVNQTAYNSASEGARKIGLDGAGKIIVGGYINNNDSLSFLALKYEQNLDFVWATRWGNNVGNINPIDMTIDNNSNIIIAGTDNATIDYATLKIDPSGVVVWGKEYSSPEGWDYCRGVAKDNLGNIYVTGETGTAGLPFSYKMTTIKYNPNGDQQWVARYQGSGPPGTDSYRGYDVAVDNTSNVYVVGNTYGNIVTAKYSPSGTLQWAMVYNGPDNSADYATAVGFDQNSNVYSTATSYSFTTWNDIAIIKYTPQPRFVVKFMHSVNRIIGDNQSASDTVSVDFTTPIDYSVEDVNVTIDTVIHSRVSDLDFVLTHDGVIDTLIYQVGGSGQNFIGTELNDSAAVAIENGTAPFTGSFRPSSPLSQFNGDDVNGSWILTVTDRATGNTGVLQAWTLSLVMNTTVTGIADEQDDVPVEFSLDQNYPNPFNPTTVIGYHLPSASHVTIKVYNILGSEVATLVDGQKNAGYGAVEWNAGQVASGVYFYQLQARQTDGRRLDSSSGQAGDFVETKKLILLR